MTGALLLKMSSPSTSRRVMISSRRDALLPYFLNLAILATFPLSSVLFHLARSFLFSPDSFHLRSHTAFLKTILAADIYWDAEDGPCDICMLQEETWRDRVIDEKLAYNSRFQIETI